MIFHSPRQVCDDLQRAEPPGEKAGESALYQPLCQGFEARDFIHTAGDYNVRKGK